MERWKADHAAMLALPPVAPSSGWTTSLRLPRDHFVRLDGNDYSVDPAAVGRRVLVSADLEQVVVTLEGARVANHVRCWARHQTITAGEHAEAAARLRAIHQRPAKPSPVTDVAHRDLADYDRIFGLDDEHDTTDRDAAPTERAS